VLRQLEIKLIKTFDLIKQEQEKSSSLLTLKLFQDYIDTTREGINSRPLELPPLPTVGSNVCENWKKPCVNEKALRA
jgi:hypothetical protein